MRLTKDVREALLRVNEGFETSTHYNGKNFTESRKYRIVDGLLHVRATGKTSWADSRFDNTWVADNDATHRFLKANLHRLKGAGVAELAKSIAADRARKHDRRHGREPGRRARPDAGHRGVANVEGSDPLHARK